MPNSGEFSVDFLGRTVNCFTLDEAVAVKTAADILNGSDPTPYSSEKLRELANVLLTYHLPDGSARLRDLANRRQE